MSTMKTRFYFIPRKIIEKKYEKKLSNKITQHSEKQGICFVPNQVVHLHILLKWRCARKTPPLDWPPQRGI